MLNYGQIDIVPKYRSDIKIRRDLTSPWNTQNQIINQSNINVVKVDLKIIKITLK